MESLARFCNKCLGLDDGPEQRQASNVSEQHKNKSTGCRMMPGTAKKTCALNKHSAHVIWIFALQSANANTNKEQCMKASSHTTKIHGKTRAVLPSARDPPRGTREASLKSLHACTIGISTSTSEWPCAEQPSMAFHSPQTQGSIKYSPQLTANRLLEQTDPPISWKSLHRRGQLNPPSRHRPTLSSPKNSTQHASIPPPSQDLGKPITAYKTRNFI